VTWVLDHLCEVAEEGPMDGGAMDVEKATDGSRGRCFLRARHELASVALQYVEQDRAGHNQAQTGLAPG
jgi:hypothetical protein